MSVNGSLSYPNRVTPVNSWFRAEDRESDNKTIKSGQVLKAGSFLQSDSTGKLIAHQGLSESAIADFVALTTGQTLILGGLTFTAGTGSVTAPQLVTIWSGLVAGIGYAAAATQLLAEGVDATVTGTFTAGTFSTWNTFAYETNSVTFTSTTAVTNVTDLAATGTGTAPTINKVDGAVMAKISGITLNDVDATAGDVNAEVLVEASLWANYLTWLVDPLTDTITKYDGTTVACTAYNTGTVGFDAPSTRLLQQKFVEHSEFEPLGFLLAGETRNV